MCQRSRGVLPPCRRALYRYTMAKDLGLLPCRLAQGSLDPGLPRWKNLWIWVRKLGSDSTWTGRSGIAQLTDCNSPWLSPMEEELGSGYWVLGLIPQPNREPSSDGSVRTELIKKSRKDIFSAIKKKLTFRAEGSEFGLQTSKVFGKLFSDKDKRDL